MREAVNLLEYVMAMLPPRGTSTMHHSLHRLQDGRLAVFIVDGGRWYEYALDSDDLDKPGFEVGERICALHAERTV